MRAKLKSVSNLRFALWDLFHIAFDMKRIAIEAPDRLFDLRHMIELCCPHIHQGHVDTRTRYSSQAESSEYVFVVVQI